MQVFAKTITNGPNYRVLFRTVLEKGDKGPFPEVSLSRVEGKCIFTLDRLHEHNDHAAGFSSVKDTDEYINRVTHAIEHALNDKTEWQMIYTNKKDLS